MPAAGAVSRSAAFAYLGVLYFQAPAHGAGRVDVVVSNASGESATLEGGYAYVLPESLVLDGTWEGWTGPDGHLPFEFTIENNSLTSVACSSAPPVIISPPVPIRLGQVSIDRDGVSLMIGSFLSNESAYGASMNIGTCREEWWANKR